MTVPTDRLEPFLPGGEEISVRPGVAEIDGIERCRLHVDGKEVLSFTTEWWEEGTGLREAATSAAGLSGHDSIGLGGDEKVREELPYMYSKTGALAVVSCAKPRKADQELFASARVSAVGKPDEAAMKKLIAAYAETVGKSDECA
ncbi:hypothetical protein ACGRHY_23225 [Streptomyces sp. HK10]|uniref:hypothetical protein n=1 Tax=Streptomyces sp. HK10 TaxID=3373255 RepID=UPI0037499721